MNECFTSLNFSTARPEITTAFQALPPLDAEVIYLRHHRELTNEEAAGILEVAPGVAHRHPGLPDQSRVANQGTNRTVRVTPRDKVVPVRIGHSRGDRIRWPERKARAPYSQLRSFEVGDEPTHAGDGLERCGEGRVAAHVHTVPGESGQAHSPPNSTCKSVRSVCPSLLSYEE